MGTGGQLAGWTMKLLDDDVEIGEHALMTANTWGARGRAKSHYYYELSSTHLIGDAMQQTEPAAATTARTRHHLPITVSSATFMANNVDLTKFFFKKSNEISL